MILLLVQSCGFVKKLAQIYKTYVMKIKTLNLVETCRKLNKSQPYVSGLNGKQPQNVKNIILLVNLLLNNKVHKT